MDETIKKIIKQITGCTLIVLGIAGLFLPFLQGIALIIAGLIILENKIILNWFKKIKQRWQKRK